MFSFARVPLTNQGQRERDPSGHARASGLRWSQRDGTGSVETIPVRPLLPTGTGVASSSSVRLCHVPTTRRVRDTAVRARLLRRRMRGVTRHQRNRCCTLELRGFQGLGVSNRQDPTKNGFRRNGTASPSPRSTVQLVNRVRSFQPRLIFASDEAGGTPCELVISRSGTLTSTPTRVSTMYVCASSSR